MEDLADYGPRGALNRFRRRLPPLFDADFAACSLSDLQQSILRIQDEQDRSRSMMDLTRLQPFLDAIDELRQLLLPHSVSEAPPGLNEFDPHLDADTEADVEPCQLISFTYGPMRLLLQTASNWPDAFDRLLDSYLRLGRAMPPLKDKDQIFRASSEIRAVLSDIFVDVLAFHDAALRIISGPAWEITFRPLWKDFIPQFNNRIIASLKLQRDLVKAHQDRETIAEQCSRPNLELVADRIKKYRHRHGTLIQANRDKVAARRREQKSDVLRWVAAPTDTQRYHERLSVSQPKYDNGSFRSWILNLDEVREWTSESAAGFSSGDYGPILWIVGPPGIGKTYLSSIIIEECKRRSHCNVIYLYYRWSDPGRNTFMEVLRSLLDQLVVSGSHDAVIPIVYDSMISNGQDALCGEEQARTLANTILDLTPGQYIVIDGLDECPAAERCAIADFFFDALRRRTARSDATSYSTPTRGILRVLFVGRPEIADFSTLSHDTPWILNERTNVLTLRAELFSSHVDEFIASRVNSLAPRWSLDAQAVAYVVSQVQSRTRGVFLYAKLVFRYLKMIGTKTELLTVVAASDFPGTIDQVFHVILSRLKARLDARSSMLWPRAVELFGWLLFARRPLAWHELHAIASSDPDQVAIVTAAVRADPASLRARVRDLCGPLVRIRDHESIEPIHVIGRRCILAFANMNESLMHWRLAGSCMRYLTSDCFQAGARTEDERRDLASRGGFAFQDYAAAMWTDHVYAAVTSSRGVLNGATTNQLANSHEASDRDQALALEHAPTLQATVDTFLATYRDGIERIADATLPRNEGLSSLPTVLGPQLDLLCRHVFSSQRRFAGGRAAFRPYLTVPQIEAVLQDNRRVVEQVAVEDGSRMAGVIGRGPFRCRQALCPRFHIGFATAAERGWHDSRHERPFVCPEAGCLNTTVGFPSQKDRDRHMRQYHPDESEQLPPFVQPSRRIEAARFLCELCTKSFTRKINLVGHMRTHFGQRPYACHTCHKAFARANDCKRHEKIHTRIGRGAGGPTAPPADDGPSGTGGTDGAAA